MANQPDLDDPYRPNRTDNEIRSMLENEPQPGSEPVGRASGGRIALFAVAIAIVLGAVFYGLNNSSTSSTGTGTAQMPSANQSSAQTSPPPVPPGIRDVTPRNNTAPGVTTGAAPGQPQQSPTAAMNRPPSPPASGAPAAKQSD